MALEGVTIIRTVTGASTLGFMPVAVHFGLFQLLVKLDREVTAAEVVQEVSKNEDIKSILNLRLADDTLFIMAGAGLISMTGEKFKANNVTKHMVSNPTSIDGIEHFSREALLAAAFIYPKLVDSGFVYPFKESADPFQYAHEKMGNVKFSNQHFFATLHDQGRLDSFNYFMEGKFGISTKMPSRLKALGYDLDAVMLAQESPIIVDIGGGQGMMLLEIKEAYPHLTAKNLILQEYNADSKPGSEITAMEWDAKGSSPQPIIGADVYSLMHIFHNTPDLESMQLLKKLSDAMKPESRLWIHEFSHSLSNSNMHATMIAFFGGRERRPKEWHAMADVAGLKITFEAYAEVGEGLIVMQKA